MIKQANILFIQSSISGNDPGLLNALSRNAYHQQLICSLLARSINTKEGFNTLGRQLANVASHAYSARQTDVMEQASRLMLALPVSNNLRCIAHHYQALLKKDSGDVEGARQQFERVLEEAPPRYKARAMLSIGAIYIQKNQAEASLPFFLEAGKAALNCDPFSLLGSQKMVAVVRSIYGDHKQALSDLERLFPTVRAIAKDYPAFYYEFLNSLAVELGEVGRITEAEAAVRIALASPFAAAYPEFTETRDEIAAKRCSATPSVVAVSAAPKSAPQPQPERKIKRAHAVNLSWVARLKSSLQISISEIALPAIARYELIRIILDLVHNAARPRAPPAHP